jgi:hypothetical protein
LAAAKRPKNGNCCVLVRCDYPLLNALMPDSLTARFCVELMNYFSSLGTSSSHPSTHGSGIGEVVQQNEVLQSVQAEAEAETPQPEPEAQPPHPEPVPEAEHEGVGLIMEFDPLVHVVADPALRKPIGRFHPNIQSDVKRRLEQIIGRSETILC